MKKISILLGVVALVVSMGLIGFVAVASPAVGPNISFVDVQEESLAAPQRRIELKDMWVTGDVLHIPVEGLVLGRGHGESNLPLHGEGSLFIFTEIFAFEDIAVGDFVVVENMMGKYVHRVVELGEDEKGLYAETRGVNNEARDLVKARPETVTRLALGILW